MTSDLRFPKVICSLLENVMYWGWLLGCTVERHCPWHLNSPLDKIRATIGITTQCKAAFLFQNNGAVRRLASWTSEGAAKGRSHLNRLHEFTMSRHEASKIFQNLVSHNSSVSTKQASSPNHYPIKGNPPPSSFLPWRLWRPHQHHRS